MSEQAAPIASDHVTFTARPSSRDIILNTMAVVRRSAVALVFGTFLTVLGVLDILDGDRISGLVSLAIGVSFLSGAMVVPIIWWSIHRRRDLLLAPIDIDADAEGIRISASYGSSQHAWSVYRRARETSRAFLLDMGTGAAALLTKRDVAVHDVDAFRSLLQRVGLLVPKNGIRAAIRPLVWVGIGLGLAAALVAGPRFVADLGATVALELSTSVDGTQATIEGTTDLPDGARVGVQVLQLDEWEKASSDGAHPDIESWQWVDYVDAYVHDGRFSKTFSVDDWPSGRGLAVAYFWVDASQPEAVIERFGSTGDDLKGADVTDADYGRTLEVQRVFQIP